MKQLFLVSVLVLLCPVEGLADFDAGAAAYDRGDFATAMREWRPLAEADDAKAQYSLGVMYAKGEGVRKDYAETVKWWRLAAEQGDRRAQHWLGYMYALGYGVSQNESEAVKWYRLAAEQGFPPAQYTLGLMHAEGTGVPQDDVQSYVWFARAAAQQHPAALEQGTLLRARMTPAQLAEVDRLSRELSANFTTQTVASNVDASRRYITNTRVSYRTGPGVNYQRLGVISAGREVQLETVEEEWLRVRLPDGSTAYIHGAYAQPMTPVEPAAAQ